MCNQLHIHRPTHPLAHKCALTNIVMAGAATTCADGRRGSSGGGEEGQKRRRRGLKEQRFIAYFTRSFRSWNRSQKATSVLFRTPFPSAIILSSLMNCKWREGEAGG